MPASIGPTGVLIAVIALLASLIVHVQNDFGPLDIYAPLQSAGANASAERHFAESYYHARAQFRAHAQAAGATLVTRALDDFAHLDLTIDFAILTGAPDRVVVHISGTHGVEGFAGSAIQSALLERTANAAATTPSTRDDKAPTVIFVHALNAYGFSQLRRFNEHNVDVNRNWLTPDEFATRTAADPNAYGYVDVFDVLNPSTLSGVHGSFWLKAAYYLSTKGFQAIKRATVSGNYKFPTSIFFGGHALQPSLRILQDVLAEHVQFDRVHALALIDVHTGLGKPGVDTLVLASSADAALVAQMFGEYERQTNKVVSLRDGADGVSQGYDGSFGLIIDGVTALLPVASRNNSALLMQEFGTVPGPFILKAVAEENFVYHHAPPSARLPYAEKLRDVFYLHRSASWKTAVVERGIAVFDQLVQHTQVCT